MGPIPTAFYFSLNAPTILFLSRICWNKYFYIKYKLEICLKRIYCRQNKQGQFNRHHEKMPHPLPPKETKKNDSYNKHTIQDALNRNRFLGSFVGLNLKNDKFRTRLYKHAKVLIYFHVGNSSKKCWDSALVRSLFSNEK